MKFIFKLYITQCRVLKNLVKVSFGLKDVGWEESALYYISISISDFYI